MALWADDPPGGYAQPKEALADDCSPLSDEVVRAWREQGFVLVNGVFPAELVKACQSEAVLRLPPNTSGMFGSGGIVEFPTKCPSLDQLTLHPRLLTAVGQLLGSDIVLLAQSNTWRKDGQSEEDIQKGEKLRGNQRIHMDYPNHTLLHPPEWHSPSALEIIIYLSDSSECGGQTRVVSRQGDDDEAYRWPYVDMVGVGGLLPWSNERPDAEKIVLEHSEESYEFRQKLYARECAASFAAGTILFYRHDVWHRGYPVKPGKMRLTQNLVFRLPTASWITHWNAGWARGMYEPDQYLERLVASASVQQRNALGMPPPGDSYWNRRTIEAMERRYAKLGLDLSPYKLAMEEK